MANKAKREEPKSFATEPEGRIQPPRFAAAYEDPTNRFEYNENELGRKSFEERLRILGDTHLFGKSLDVTDRLVSYDIELAILQRMVIHDLQDQLVEVTGKIHNSISASRANMRKARRLLKDYSTAIRDYDLMREKKHLATSLGNIDPFLITTKTRLGFMLLREHNMIPAPEDGHNALRRVQNKIDEDYEWNKKRCILPEDSRSQRQREVERAELLQRLWMGVAGGLALIVPMLIMVLHRDLITTLLVASVSTLLFAGVLALRGQGLKGETVLSAVAAYAAVLVVFVGASS